MDEPPWWEHFRQEEARKAERRRQQATEKQAQIERLQALPPLPRRAVPRPWEDLASLLSRTARTMGYERPEWLLHPQDRSYWINPAAVSLMSRDQEYMALRRQLVLEEHQIHELTLHRFTPRFLRQPPPFSPDPLERQQGPGRPGLPYEVSRRFFLAGRETKVCPHCLDEKDGYDCLYWRCTLILFCPHHQVFLHSHCPDCYAPVPALRPLRTQCPV